MDYFELNEKKMKAVKGGRYCCCACAYADSGGSSTVDNRDANYDGGVNGLSSPECT